MGKQRIAFAKRHRRLPQRPAGALLADMGQQFVKRADLSIGQRRKLQAMGGIEGLDQLIEADRVEAITVEILVVFQFRRGDAQRQAGQGPDLLPQVRSGRFHRCGRTLGMQTQAQALHIAVDHHRLIALPRHQLMERRQAMFAAQGLHPRLALQQGAGLGIQLHAAVLPQAPADRERPAMAFACADLGLALFGKTVHKAIGRRIGGLAGMPDRRGGRGKQHKAVEAAMPRRLVERQGPGDLARQHDIALLRLQVPQEGVAQLTGTMQHRAQAAMTGLDLGHQPFGGRRIGDIQSFIDHLAAQLPQGLQACLCRGVRSGTADQHQGGAPDPREDIPGKQLCQATQATGEKIDTGFFPGAGAVLGQQRNLRPLTRLATLCIEAQPGVLVQGGGLGHGLAHLLAGKAGIELDQLGQHLAALPLRRTQQSMQPAQPGRGAGADNHLQARDARARLDDQFAQVLADAFDTVAITLGRGLGSTPDPQPAFIHQDALPLAGQHRARQVVDERSRPIRQDLPAWANQQRADAGRLRCRFHRQHSHLKPTPCWHQHRCRFDKFLVEAVAGKTDAPGTAPRHQAFPVDRLPRTPQLRQRFQATLRIPGVEQGQRRRVVTEQGDTLAALHRSHLQSLSRGPFAITNQGRDQFGGRAGHIAQAPLHRLTTDLERVADIRQRQLRINLEILADRAGLAPQRRLIAGGQQEQAGGLFLPWRLARRRGLADDHMGIAAAGAEGRQAGDPLAITTLPGFKLLGHTKR